MSATDAFARISAVNVGLTGFADAVAAQGAPVVDLDWRPPAEGDAATVAMLTPLWGAHGARIATANADALARIESSRPMAVGVEPAGTVIAGLEGPMLLHSGPPITWDRVCDPQRRALVAAVLFEGWADNREAAAKLLATGDITLAPGHHHDHVGPMTGVCSASMPVWIVEDSAAGTQAYSTLNEGSGNTLWFGVGDDESIERLRFFRDTVGPLVARLLAHCGPVEVFALAAQGLGMGDELHMRSQATGNLLVRHFAPGFAALGGEDVAAFITGNHHFFLNLTMAAAKCASLAASEVADSTVVSMISRNGTDVGVQLAGMPGQWFTSPAASVQDALLREGYTPDDAALDIGDSAVIECIGLGGMAVAAAPAVAAFFGGGSADAAARVTQMAEITVGRSQRFLIPGLDFAGSPTAIDARLVVELGVTPQITTGVLHKTSGAGQIGAGIAHQPIEPFRAALAALGEALNAD